MKLQKPIDTLALRCRVGQEEEKDYWVSIQLSVVSRQLKTSYSADDLNGLKAKDYEFLARAPQVAWPKGQGTDIKPMVTSFIQKHRLRYLRCCANSSVAQASTL
ncbi:MAG: hypothetical protein F6K56_13980 [Moorea sp. SIO3G5]|nr:hypothetical protein [Moorena sp. SIO3G5]